MRLFDEIKKIARHVLVSQGLKAAYNSAAECGNAVVEALKADQGAGHLILGYMAEDYLRIKIDLYVHAQTTRAAEFFLATNTGKRLAKALLHSWEHSMFQPPQPVSGLEAIWESLEKTYNRGVEPRKIAGSIKPAGGRSENPDRIETGVMPPHLLDQIFRHRGFSNVPLDIRVGRGGEARGPYVINHASGKVEIDTYHRN